MTCESVILAAGLGTRMKSDLPKVLHPLGERPLLLWSIDACREAVGKAPYVVVGPEADEVRAAAGEDVEFVVQAERLGTGHALLAAAHELRGVSDHVLVTSADMPLIPAARLRALIELQRDNPGPLTALTGVFDPPRGFGRVLREGGTIVGVVEEAVASPDQRAIRELNIGAYCFDGEWLWDRLPRLPLSAKGEYYLTDLIGMAAAEGEPIASVVMEDADEAIGVNTREHLAEAEGALRRRINRGWMLAGVTLTDPATVYIGPQVRIGRDTVIHPNTHLQGHTSIGRGCRLGPNSVIRDSTLADDCRVEASFVEGAELEEEVEIGPFGHLRPGAVLGRGVHMGNFGEVKNSRLGAGVRMGHFSYIGDASVGAGANIGAGTVTCNYDGERKHRTDIDEGAFIGSDTMLVAPVRVGRGARTGAGSVVTRDVPDEAVAVGVPARVIRRLKRGDG